MGGQLAAPEGAASYRPVLGELAGAGDLVEQELAVDERGEATEAAVVVVHAPS